MKSKSVTALMVIAMFAVCVAAEQGFAAMQIRKKTGGDAPAGGAPSEGAPPAAPAQTAAPAPAGEAAAAPSSAPAAALTPAAAAEEEAKPRKITPESFVGSVVYVRGDKILAEIPGGAKKNERYMVYSTRLKRLGRAIVERQVSKGMFMLKVQRGGGSQGDRLARETEKEAYTRVRSADTVEAYKEFLQVFPQSPLVGRVAQRMFRLNLRETFPAPDGGAIFGQVKLEEQVSQEIPLARAMIKLDRFVIGMTDDAGKFSLDGIPVAEYPVSLKLMVRDEKFEMAKEIIVDIPAAAPAKIEKDLPVKLTPTYLVGTVKDSSGTPIREAEVWTSPYTMEVLTDEKGQFRISRKKKVDASGGLLEGDEPLLGRDYKIYAYRKGFGAESVDIEAGNFKENKTPDLRLANQDPYEEGVPDLDVDLRANLDLMQFVVPAGSGPKFNR
jgi:hypothetical protein